MIASIFFITVHPRLKCASEIGRAVQRHVWRWSRGHLHPYFEFWTATQGPLALLGAAAAIEAFWRLALHFRNVRAFGFVLLGGIPGVAAMATWIVAAMNSKWHGPLSGRLRFEECVELALMIVAMLSLGFFRLAPSIPVRPASRCRSVRLAFSDSLGGAAPSISSKLPSTLSGSKCSDGAPAPPAPTPPTPPCVASPPGPPAAPAPLAPK